MPQDIGVSLHGRRVGLAAAGPGISAGLVINHVAPTNHQTLLGLSRTIQLTSAQLLALNATPIALLPAPDAGIATVVTRWAIYKPAGTAYAGVAAGADLVLKYTGAAGAQVSSVIETTGFLDQATDQNRVAGMPGSTGATAGDYAPINAPVVIHILASGLTTGTSPLWVRIWYDLIPLNYTV